MPQLCTVTLGCHKPLSYLRILCPSNTDPTPTARGWWEGVDTLPLRRYVTDLPCGLRSNWTFPGNHPWAAFSSHASLRLSMILADTELEVQGDWATALWNPKMTGCLLCGMPWQCEGIKAERLTPSPEKWHVSVKP